MGLAQAPFTSFIVFFPSAALFFLVFLFFSSVVPFRLSSHVFFWLVYLSMSLFFFFFLPSAFS